MTDLTFPSAGARLTRGSVRERELTEILHQILYFQASQTRTGPALVGSAGDIYRNNISIKQT